MHSDYLKEHFLTSINIKKTFLNDKENLNTFDEIVDLAINCYKNKGKIIWIGNGGSAADAQHLAAEFICKLGRDRPPLAAESLSVDPSVVTSISNDFGYKNIFKRQLEAKVNKNDIVIAISTSGASKNIIYALQYLRSKNINTILFTGKNGGLAKTYANKIIHIESDRTEFIQECHIMLGHCLCYCVEDQLFFKDNK